MKNKLIDLNNHLFAALERLSDEEIHGEKLQEEIARSKSITDVSRTIISTAKIALDAQKHMDEYGYDRKEKQLPEMFIEHKGPGNA
jgi:hypothetical protein